MGKMKHRTLGLEEVEQEQKKEQKRKSEEKKIVAKEEPSSKVEEAETKVDKKTKKTEKKEKKAVKRLRGLQYKEAKKNVDSKKVYSIESAVQLIKKIAYAKFNEAVELHLNVDSTGLKGEVELPHSIGKSVRVAVVDDALLDKIAAGKIEFDMLVTHPSFMPKLARFAKVLGPKGLMPNPKNGTISPKPEDVVKKFSKGVLRWKTEPKFPLIHQMVGRVQFEDKQLVENISTFFAVVGKAHILSAFLKSTMGPAVRIEVT